MPVMHLLEEKSEALRRAGARFSEIVLLEYAHIPRIEDT
jgi:hypothetical protein